MVGGNSKYEVPLQLHSIAMHQQSVLGVHRGTRSQLSELVELVAAKEVRHCCIIVQHHSVNEWQLSYRPRHRASREFL